MKFQYPFLFLQTVLVSGLPFSLAFATLPELCLSLIVDPLPVRLF